MAAPSSLKILLPSLSLGSSWKLVIQTFILSHMNRIPRILAKAKTLVIQVIKNKNKLFLLESFRLQHYICSSSSHVMPVPAVIKRMSRDVWNYDSSWNTLFSTDSADDDSEATLSRYLHWLEGKAAGKTTDKDSGYEIDRLADMFIAKSHEKFRLEKEESYRRFHERMARSL